MKNVAKIAAAAAALGVLAVLFVVLRPADEDGQASEMQADATTQTEAGATTAPTDPTTTRAQPVSPGPLRVRIAVRSGVDRVRRVQIEQGRRVVLTVTADVADHIHVHGYDLLADVVPGQPARISFRADVPGRFEIELEDRGLLIGELEVTP